MPGGPWRRQAEEMSSLTLFFPSMEILVCSGRAYGGWLEGSNFSGLRARGAFGFVVLQLITENESFVSSMNMFSTVLNSGIPRLGSHTWQGFSPWGKEEGASFHREALWQPQSVQQEEAAIQHHCLAINPSVHRHHNGSLFKINVQFIYKEVYKVSWKILSENEEETLLVVKGRQDLGDGFSQS